MKMAILIPGVVDGGDDGDDLLGWLLQAGSVGTLPLDTKLCQTWSWLMLIWVNIFSYSNCYTIILDHTLSCTEELSYYLVYIL